MAPPMSGLNDHAAAGGAHHEVQVRSVLGRRQSAEYPVHRGQIADVQLLPCGPGAERSQDGAPRFVHQRPCR